jgi:hypothetical protein
MIPPETPHPVTIRAPADRGLFWVTRRAARFALYVLHAAAVLVVAVEIARPLDADGHGVERVAALDFPASYALYGFVACVVLVVLGRGLRRLVMRHERYYEQER